MKLLTTNKSISYPLLTLAAFFSLYLVASAQDSAVTATESTSVEAGNTVSIEQEGTVESGLDNQYPSVPGRGPADREPRPEERGVPTLYERQETTEDRQQLQQDKKDERASTTEQKQETRELNVEQRQALRLERQTALQDVRQQRVLNLSANISNRMDAAIERIFDIITRLEQRVEKLKATGVDTAAAEVKLREAAQILSEARASISDIDNIVYSATTSAEPATEWQSVKATYKNAAALIRASHAALRETVSLLKTAVVNADLRTNAAVQAEASASTTTETE